MELPLHARFVHDAGEIEIHDRTSKAQDRLIARLQQQQAAGAGREDD